MQTEKGNGPQEEAKDVSDNDASVGDFKSPFDFPVWRKWILTVLLATTTLTVTFASSVFSSTITVTSAEFGVSDTVMILGVSLYVLGFAIGPIVWGPLSELKGRKLPLFGGFFVFAIMQIPVALAHNLPTILICRLLAGCFGAAPVVLVSAMYADFWAPADRGTATAVYSAAVYAGPTLGPIVGAFLTESHLGWRWTAWVTLIMSATAGPVALIFVPETYGLVLRERAAKKLRIPVGGSTTRPATREHSPGLKNFVGTFLTKPAHMLACEPMVCSVLHTKSHCSRTDASAASYNNFIHLDCLRDSLPYILRLPVQLYS
jgi:DHA1 family multidrug resistance protein-like MFS transporter